MRDQQQPARKATVPTAIVEHDDLVEILGSLEGRKNARAGEDRDPGPSVVRSQRVQRGGGKHYVPDPVIGANEKSPHRGGIGRKHQ